MKMTANDISAAATWFFVIADASSPTAIRNWPMSSTPTYPAATGPRSIIAEPFEKYCRMSTYNPVSAHINVYNVTAPSHFADTTSKSVTGAVINISIDPDRFSSASNRIVIAGTTKSDGSQNMLNMIFIAVNCVGPRFR